MPEPQPESLPRHAAPSDDEKLSRLRAETPVCNERIHFNNAGASPTPEPVHRVVADFLDQERRIGGYEATAAERVAVEGFYSSVAKTLGAEPDEIAYLENATRAWSMIFYGLPFERGDEIIIHSSDYVSNYLSFLRLRDTFGLTVKIASSQETGEVDPDSVKALISSKTRLISISHIPTHSAVINPVASVGSVAREHGIPFLVDACQSVGQCKVDVNEIQCDFLSGSGRKFLRAPRGTGFLYARSDALKLVNPPVVDVVSALWQSSEDYELVAGARRFETWERNFAGQIGLGCAVEYMLELGIDWIEARVQYLAELLRARLSQVPGITVLDVGRRLSGIVTFNHERMGADRVRSELGQRNINVHVIRARFAMLDLPLRGIDDLVRASVHYFNTEEEIDAFIDALQSI